MTSVPTFDNFFGSCDGTFIESFNYSGKYDRGLGNVDEFDKLTGTKLHYVMTHGNSTGDIHQDFMDFIVDIAKYHRNFLTPKDSSTPMIINKVNRIDELNNLAYNHLTESIDKLLVAQNAMESNADEKGLSNVFNSAKYDKLMTYHIGELDKMLLAAQKNQVNANNELDVMLKDATQTGKKDVIKKLHENREKMNRNVVTLAKLIDSFKSKTRSVKDKVDKILQEAENANLKSGINTNSDNLDELQKRYDESEKIIASQRQEITLMESEIESKLSSERTALDKCKKDLTSYNNELNRLVELRDADLKIKIDEHNEISTRTLKNDKKEIAKLTGEIDRLKSVIESNANTELQKENSVKAELDKIQVTLDNKIRECSEKGKDLESQIDKLRFEKGEYGDKIKSLELEIQETRAISTQQSQAQKNLTKVIDKHDDTEDKIKEKLLRKEERVLELQSSITLLEGQIKVMEGTIEQLTSRNNETQQRSLSIDKIDRTNVLEEQIKKLKSTIEELNKKEVDSTNALTEQIKILKNTHSNKIPIDSSNVNELKDQISKLKSTIDKLNDQPTPEPNGDTSGIDKLNSKIGELETTIDDLNRKNTQMTKDLISISELKDKIKKIENVSQTNLQETSSINGLNAQIKTLEDTIKELNQKNKHDLDSVNTSKNKINELMGTIDGLTKQNTKLNDQLQSATLIPNMGDISAMDSRIQEYIDTIDKQKKQVASLTEQLEREKTLYKESKAKITRNIDKLTSSKVTYQAELDTSQRIEEEANSKVYNLTSELAKLRHETDDKVRKMQLEQGKLLAQHNSVVTQAKKDKEVYFEQLNALRRSIEKDSNKDRLKEMLAQIELKESECQTRVSNKEILLQKRLDEELESVNANWEEQLQKARDELEENKRQFANKETGKDIKIKELLQNITEMEAELTLAKKINEASVIDNANLKKGTESAIHKENIAHITRVNELEETIGRLEKRIQQNQENCSKEKKLMEKNSERIPQLEREIESLNGKLKLNEKKHKIALDKAMESLVGESEDNNRNNIDVDLGVINSNHEKTVEKLTNEIEKLKRELQSSKTALDTQNIPMNNDNKLQKELDGVKDELIKTNEIHVQKILDLETTQRECSATNESLIISHKSETDDMNRQLEQLNGYIKTLTGENVAKIKEMQRTSEQSNRTSVEEINRLKGELERMHLDDTIRNKEQKAVDVDTLTNELKTLGVSQERINSVIERVKERLKREKSIIGDTTNQEDRITTLEYELDDVARKAKLEQAKSIELGYEKQRLEQMSQELQVQVKKLKSDLMTTKTASRQASHEIQEVQSQAKAQAERHIATIGKLEDELEASSTQSKQLDSTKKVLLEEQQALYKEIKRTKDELKQLTSAVDSNQSKNGRVSDYIKELETKLTRLEGQIVEKDRILGETNSAVKTCEASHEKLKGNLKIKLEEYQLDQERVKERIKREFDIEMENITAKLQKTEAIAAKRNEIIDELEGKISGVNENIKEKNDKIERLITENDKVNMYNETVDGTNERAQEEIAALKQNVTELQDEQAKLTETLEHIQQEIISKNSKNAELAVELRDHKLRLREILSIKEQQKKQINKLNGKYDKLVGDHDKLVDDLDSLQIQTKEINTKTVVEAEERIKENQKQYQEEIEKVRQQLTEANRIESDKNAELKRKLENKIISLNEQIQIATDEDHTFHQEQAVERQSHDEAVAQLEAKINEIKNEQQKCRLELETATKSYDITVKECTEAKEQCVTATTRLEEAYKAELSEKNQSYEKDMKVLREQLENDIANKDKHMQESKEALDELEGARQALKEELVSQREANDSLEEINKGLVNEIDTKNSELIKSKRTEQELIAKSFLVNDKVETLEKRIEELVNVKDTLDDEIGKLIASNKSGSLDNSKLKKQLKQLHKEAKEKLASKTAELEILKETHDSLKSKLTACNNNINKLDDEKSELETTLYRNREHFEQDKDSLNKLLTQAKRSAKEELEKASGEKNKAVQELRKLLDEADKANKSTRTDLSDTADELQSVREELAQTQAKFLTEEEKAKERESNEREEERKANEREEEREANERKAKEREEDEAIKAKARESKEREEEREANEREEERKAKEREEEREANESEAEAEAMNSLVEKHKSKSASEKASITVKKDKKDKKHKKQKSRKNSPNQDSGSTTSDETYKEAKRVKEKARDIEIHQLGELVKKYMEIYIPFGNNKDKLDKLITAKNEFAELSTKLKNSMNNIPDKLNQYLEIVAKSFGETIKSLKGTTDQIGGGYITELDDIIDIIDEVKSLDLVTSDMFDYGTFNKTTRVKIIDDISKLIKGFTNQSISLKLSKDYVDKIETLVENQKKYVEAYNTNSEYIPQLTKLYGEIVAIYQKNKRHIHRVKKEKIEEVQSMQKRVVSFDDNYSKDYTINRNKINDDPVIQKIITFYEYYTGLITTIKSVFDSLNSMCDANIEQYTKKYKEYKLINESTTLDYMLRYNIKKSNNSIDEIHALTSLKENDDDEKTLEILFHRHMPFELLKKELATKRSAIKSMLSIDISEYQDTLSAVEDMSGGGKGEGKSNEYYLHLVNTRPSTLDAKSHRLLTAFLTPDYVLKRDKEGLTLFGKTLPIAPVGKKAYVTVEGKVVKVNISKRTFIRDVYEDVLRGNERFTGEHKTMTDNPEFTRNYFKYEQWIRDEQEHLVKKGKEITVCNNCKNSYGAECSACHKLYLIVSENQGDLSNTIKELNGKLLSNATVEIDTAHPYVLILTLKKLGYPGILVNNSNTGISYIEPQNIDNWLNSLPVNIRDDAIQNKEFVQYIKYATEYLRDNPAILNRNHNSTKSNPSDQKGGGLITHRTVKIDKRVKSTICKDCSN